MKRNICLSVFGSVLLLTSCATSPETSEFKGDETQNVRTAVSSPVNDVGLRDIDIPDYLATMTKPYADVPADCAAFSSELARLDSLLGADLDVPEEEAQAREQRALNATSETVGSVLIPFRGVVRFISGAAANEREAREAYQRGLVRRAYLKGLFEERRCTSQKE